MKTALTRRILLSLMLISAFTATGCHRTYNGATEGVPIWTGDANKLESGTTISTNGTSASAVNAAPAASTAITSVGQQSSGQLIVQTGKGPVRPTATEGVPIWATDTTVNGGQPTTMSVELKPGLSDTEVEVMITSPQIPQAELERSFIGKPLPLKYTVPALSDRVALVIPTVTDAERPELSVVLFVATKNKIGKLGVTSKLVWTNPATPSLVDHP